MFKTQSKYKLNIIVFKLKFKTILRNFESDFINKCLNRQKEIMIVVDGILDLTLKSFNFMRINLDRKTGFSFTMNILALLFRPLKFFVKNLELYKNWSI